MKQNVGNARFVVEEAFHEELTILPLPKSNISSHYHHHMEIYYVEKGKACATVNTTTATLESNSLYIADCFCTHSCSITEGTTGFYIAIPVSYLQNYRILTAQKKLSTNFILDSKIAKKIKFFMDLIKKSLASESTIKLHTEGLVNAMLGLILEHVPTIQTNERNEDIIKDIAYYISTNFADKLYLEDVAKVFGYSKYTFSRIFNKNFKCNFSNYVNHIRCRNVITLLNSNPQYTILSAAMESGFASVSAFYKFFKANYKGAPNDIKKISLETISGMISLDNLHV